MKKHIKIVIIIILLICIICVGYVITKRAKTSVREIRVEKRIIQRTISAPGTVKAKQEVSLSFASMGRIAQIYVDDNQFVSKGYLLAVIDNYVDSQTAQSYKDTRDAALRDLDYFIQEYENDKDDIGGDEEYDIQLRKYKELVSKAEAAYQASLGSVARGYIYAPFDGYIIDIYKKEGETAAIAESIIKLADINNLYFEIDVDQEDFGYLKEGMSAEISLDSFDNRKFNAVVANLPKYTNSSTGSDFVIDIEFVDPNKKDILLGMQGDAYIILAKTDNEVNSIAFDEIYYDYEDKPYIFILENNKVKKQNIELGLQGDIYTQIITDIPQYILSPATPKDKIEEGNVVKIIKQN